MTVRATVHQTTRDDISCKVLSHQTFDIEAPTEPELFALFFRDHDNRYKYVSTVSSTFADPVLLPKYAAWRQNPANYAAAGGDMW